MKISELRPYSKKVDLTVKVLEKNEPREVTSKLDSSTHTVTEALVGDETGTALLTLWDKSIEEVQVGKAYNITNAYTSTFKNSLRISIGRYGKLGESKEKIGEINKENNISEKELTMK